jgi:hypothetical protein
VSRCVVADFRTVLCCVGCGVPFTFQSSNASSQIQLACLANFETLIAAAAYAAPAVRRQTIKTKTIPENPKRPFPVPESCPFANCKCRQCSVVRQVSTTSRKLLSQTQSCTAIKLSCFQHALPSDNAPSMSPTLYRSLNILKLPLGGLHSRGGLIHAPLQTSTNRFSRLKTSPVPLVFLQIFPPATPLSNTASW